MSKYSDLRRNLYDKYIPIEKDDEYKPKLPDHEKIKNYKDLG